MNNFYEYGRLTLPSSVPIVEKPAPPEPDLIIPARLYVQNDIRPISLDAGFAKEHLLVHNLAHYRRPQPVFLLEQNIDEPLDFLVEEELLNVKDGVIDFD